MTPRRSSVKPMRRRREAMTDGLTPYIPTIPVEMEDDPVHTAANGYCCGDPTCFCAGSSDDDTIIIVEGSLIYVDETDLLSE